MNNKKGFTLFEMLIVTMVLVIIGTIGSLILYKGFQSGLKNRDIIEATWQNRLVLQRMINEIGDVRSQSDVTINSNLQFTFTDIFGNTIIYSRSGNFLQRTFNGVTKNVADGVTALNFSYYDINNAITTTASFLKCIKIVATVTKNNTAQNFQSLICPRNLL